jgi:hypothetical protein
MKPEASVRCLQKPATDHYPEPDESSLQVPSLLLKINKF